MYNIDDDISKCFHLLLLLPFLCHIMPVSVLHFLQTVKILQCYFKMFYLTYKKAFADLYVGFFFCFLFSYFLFDMYTSLICAMLKHVFDACVLTL